VLNPPLSCFGQLDHEQSQDSQFSHEPIHASGAPKEEPFGGVHSWQPFLSLPLNPQIPNTSTTPQQQL